MKKRSLSFLLALSLVLGSAAALPQEAFTNSTSITASAESTETSGKCGDNVSWTLSEDGVLTISGNGKMTDYSYGSSPFDHRTDIKSIVIGSGATSVGKYAFYYCPNLTSITIPESVTIIQSNAISYCKSLTGVVIPNSVTTIGGYAFAYCSNLENITIPSNVKSIGISTFDDTKWLKNEQNKNPMVVVNGMLIDGHKCYGNVTIPNSVTSIVANAFSSSSLTSVTIPSSVTEIGASTFMQCKNLTSVTIPDSVTRIDGYAFDRCESLTDITIPSSVTTIGSDAFWGCTSLKCITIPSSVTDIADFALGYYCDSSLHIKKFDNFTIIGESGSAALRYAVENGFKFAAQCRIAGKNRFATAAAISQQIRNKSDVVVLAYGMNYADALAGVPLAYGLNAPILLTKTNEIPDETFKEIERLGAKNVVILGGEGAIGSSVENQLKEKNLNTVRVSGENRFSTAVQIAQNVNPTPSEVFFVYGYDFADALSVSTVAAIKGAPIIYLSKDGSIDKDTADYLAKLKEAKCVSAAYVIGGTGVISDSMLKKAGDALGVKPTRVAGQNRYETCNAINTKFESVLTGSSVCAAKGLDFPDALAGGVFAAKKRSPLILVDDSLKEEQKTYLKTKETENSYIFGDIGAVSNMLAEEIAINSRAS